ncbi:hypothetical protein [Azospirillum doebereinerae]|uniref:hypothetical protein n=1 Tax=Azospirillum doebereinerae TaxID=92933 RepID=UPI00163BABFB|nr:hypothetical protein [Azospirillum doebereinerae]
MTDSLGTEFTRHTEEVLASMTLMAELLPAGERRDLLALKGRVKVLAERATRKPAPH